MIDLSQRPELDEWLDELLDRPRAQQEALLAERKPSPELRELLAIVLAEVNVNDRFLDPADLPGRPVISDFQSSLSEKDEEDEEREQALAPGQLFAQYEIVSLIGRGGMGEVYRARDPRLAREVALKVLPDDVARDPERLARLEREARMLAALNHPNVAAIHGFAESGARHALVLECVEGETLADRIGRGSMKTSDVVAVARQIAAALDAAHRRGIVHRDLKPANIRITADGTVKVLDFGLAKAVIHREEPSAAGAGLTSVWKPDGAVLGTPAYMAPEQAQGKAIDYRVDLWAFGCVLYEMLTGARAFEADNASATIARVLEREPDLTRLPAGTPEALRRLLRRALAKDPARRPASMAEAVLELDEAEAASRSRLGLRVSTAWPAFVGIAALIVAAVWITLGPADRRLREWMSPPPAIRLGVPISARETLLISGQQVAALSPDGTTIVYRAVRDGAVQLFSRRLTETESTPIPGTLNAAAPFFSPDGAWVGFDGDGVLQRVSLAGGSPLTIGPAHGGANASWGGEIIVFATSTARVLQRVPATGGTPRPVTSLDQARGDVAHGFPHVLPAGDAVLFTIATPQTRHVAVVHLATGDTRLLTEGSQPRYLAGGYLLFVRNDALWAAPFDSRTLVLTGEPQPIVTGLDTAGGSAAHFSASDTGTLLYVPRREEVRDRRLVWVERNGTERPLPMEPRRYQRATLSPDQRRVAVALSEEDNTDIWIGDVEQATLMRVTREPGSDTAPLWSTDGRSVVFRSDREGGGLFQASAGPSASVRRLTSSGQSLHTAHGWTPDGETLLFTEFLSYTQQRFAALDMRTREVRPLLDGEFAQLRPQVSPDGRWLVYQSDESGRFEVYIRPYPSVQAEVWQLSTRGGVAPRWTKGGAEIVYYDGRGFVAVPVTKRGTEPITAEGQRLFDYSPYSGRLGPDYDVTPDGQRFLFVRSAEDTPASRVQLVLIQHWLTELRSRLAQR